MLELLYSPTVFIVCNTLSDHLHTHTLFIATAKPGCRALSKLIDFPGDAEEIKKYLDDPGELVRVSE